MSGRHCSPGTTYEGFRAYTEAGGPMSNCNGYDPTMVGGTATERIFVRNIALTSPLAANQSMAVSIEFIAGDATVEFWGTNAECGGGAELLGSAEAAAPNITCVDLSGTANYSHLIMVWRQGGGQHGDVTICATGSCS
jgi:hypothetical protein